MEAIEMDAFQRIDLKLLGFIVATALAAMSVSALVIDAIYCLQGYAG